MKHRKRSRANSVSVARLNCGVSYFCSGHFSSVKTDVRLTALRSGVSPFRNTRNKSIRVAFAVSNARIGDRPIRVQGRHSTFLSNVSHSTRTIQIRRCARARTARQIDFHRYGAFAICHGHCRPIRARDRPEKFRQAGTGYLFRNENFFTGEEIDQSFYL